MPFASLPPSNPGDPGADLELVRRALAGEEAAITELSQQLKCVPRMLAARNRRMGRPLNEHDLADLGQETSMIIVRKLDEFEGRAPLEGWIYKICEFEFRNGLRRKRRQLPTVDNDLETEQPSADPETVNRMAMSERVERALAEVGGVEAETVRWKFFEDLTFKEMGERTGMSPNTLKTRFYRGMERLKLILARDEETDR